MPTAVWLHPRRASRPLTRRNFFLFCAQRRMQQRADVLLRPLYVRYIYAWASLSIRFSGENTERCHAQPRVPGVNSFLFLPTYYLQDGVRFFHALAFFYAFQVFAGLWSFISDERTGVRIFNFRLFYNKYLLTSL